MICRESDGTISLTFGDLESKRCRPACKEDDCTYWRDPCLDVVELSQVKSRQDSVYLAWRLAEATEGWDRFSYSPVIFQSSVNDLGVTVDGPLTMRGIMSRKFAVHHLTSFASFESSVALLLSMPAQCWFMLLFQAGSITVIRSNSTTRTTV